MSGLNWIHYLNAVQAQAANEAGREMTTGSWIYMLVVWGTIISLNIFCFRRIFRK